MNRTRLLLVGFLLVIIAGAALPATASMTNQGRDASLEVHQPYYVDSPVKRTSTNNTTVYKVRGNTHEIELENANHSQVVDFGVVNGKATLSFDKEIDRYVLNAQGSDASYRVFWTVSRLESFEVNNTTRTRSVTSRYQAVIQVSNAGVKHVEQSKFEKLSNQAANWTATKELFAPIGDADTPIESKLQRAAVVLKALTNPLGAVTGQIATILLLTIMTPGGLILLGISFLAIFGSIYGITSRLNKREKQLEDIDDIEREKDKQAAERKKRDLSQCDPIDAGLNDHHASVIREKVGPNLLMVFDSLSREITADRWTKTNLQILKELGYKMTIEERIEDGSIERVEFVEPEEVEAIETLTEEGETTEPELLEPSEELLDAVTEEQLRSLRVDFAQADIDAKAVDLPVANGEGADGDLIDAWNIDIGTDFESRERFTEEILNILSFVAGHNYTDAEGKVRKDVDLLSMLNLFATTGAERYDLPRLPEYQSVFEAALNNLSQSDRSKSKIKTIQDGGSTDD